MELSIADDGVRRCWWGATPEVYREYHDVEWGRPVVDDDRLFEKICLEGFQSGLSWLTILRKRESFREAFAGFDPVEVSQFDEEHVARLMGNAAIVRHEGKIRSTINNAGKALDLIDDAGSLASYFWRWVEPETSPPSTIPAFTPASTALASDLKSRGWSFVGPTTAYAFMQAMGLVNDHIDGCVARNSCEDERRRVMPSTL